MKMENISYQKKCRWKNVYERGNILLVLTLLGTLSGGIATYTFVYLGNYDKEKKRLQRDLSEKQWMMLSKMAYESLKTMASSNSIIPVIKSDGLHFFDTSIQPIEDLGILDKNFENGQLGYKISAVFDEFPKSFPEFQQIGYRKPLDDWMTLDTHVLEGVLKGSLDETKFKLAVLIELAKKRWVALKKDKTESLPMSLFVPFLTSVDVCNQGIKLKFFNPYDRKLTGRLKIAYFTMGPCSSKKTKFAFARVSRRNKEKIMEVNIEKGENVEVDIDCTDSFSIKTDDFSFGKWKIEGGKGKYCLKVPNELCKDFWPYENRLTNDENAWSMNYDKATLFWTTKEIGMENYRTIFYTDTWIEKLNACLFFPDGSPYKKIGNFIEDSCKSLNHWVWNRMIIDKTAHFINFNAPKLYIEQQLQHIFGNDLNEDDVGLMAEEIVSGQVFIDGFSFIKQIQGNFKEKLHLFQNLSARTDEFIIDVWLKQSHSKDVRHRITAVTRTEKAGDMVWEKHDISEIRKVKEP